jgi:superfamily II DNA/RNA helicase
MKFNCCSKLLKLHQRAFKTLQIHDSIIERLKLKGITKPSNSQRAMLPVLYSNTDLILKDATGSGKTLGLCLGVLSKKVQELAPQMRFDSEPLSQQQLDFNKRRLGKTYLAILFIVPTRFVCF